MKIQVKRIYDPPSKEDGTRLRVDRIWPRGLSKESAKIDAWLKDFAPSTELRRWFGHDPAKWAEFQKRYYAELDQKPDVKKTILPTKTKGTVTLLFGAKDTEHNNAVALKSYLQPRSPKGK
jgi:uncharacterized protein YeaO (DUF488 family)